MILRLKSIHIVLVCFLDSMLTIITIYYDYNKKLLLLKLLLKRKKKFPCKLDSTLYIKFIFIQNILYHSFFINIFLYFQSFNKIYK